MSPKKPGSGRERPGRRVGRTYRAQCQGLVQTKALLLPPVTTAQSSCVGLQLLTWSSYRVPGAVPGAGIQGSAPARGTVVGLSKGTDTTLRSSPRGSLTSRSLTLHPCPASSSPLPTLSHTSHHCVANHLGERLVFSQYITDLYFCKIK